MNKTTTTQQQQQQQQQQRKIGSANKALISSGIFQVLVVLLVCTLVVCGSLAFLLLFPDHHQQHDQHQQQNQHQRDPYHQPISKDIHQYNISSDIKENNNNNKNNELFPHLYPRLPHLPAFPTIENEKELIDDTLRNNKPTIAGIGAILNHFIHDLRESNREMVLAEENEQEVLVEPADIRAIYYSLTSKHLIPLDKALKQSSFPKIRTDGSIFMSVAAFREHILADTLKSAFRYSTNPNKLFIGAVVQNCFGTETSFFSSSSSSCKTGWQIVDKKKDIREMLDAPPDKNGIEEFCADEEFTKYCDAGQLRVLYVHETEALGPAVARYLASKLWGGENYYVQVDSHLQFAKGWDELYINDLKLARSYPKAVLSTYPPGFINFHQEPPYTRGTRICKCRFSPGDGNMVRVEMNGRCIENESRPTQMPFVGAGFVFAHSQILRDVPYDPYLPWCFMGEEIAYSMRAWTNGWNIYAPRINLIGHHYRPLKLGLPHYWETVNRMFPDRAEELMKSPRKRIKHLLGYPAFTKEKLETERDREIMKKTKKNKKNAITLEGLNAADDIYYDVLQDLELYGLGHNRTAADYLSFAEIDFKTQTCGDLTWCTNEELE